MRYREIIERSVRMGAKDLASTKTEGFLVGFEFEIACEPSLVKKDETDARYEFDDTPRLHPDTSFEEWLADEFGRDPAKMINYYDLEPVHPVTAGDMWEEDGEDPDEEPEDKDEVVPGKYFDGWYICDYNEVKDEYTLESNFANSSEAIRDYHSWVESKMDRAFLDWYAELDYDKENTEDEIEEVYDALILPFDIVIDGDYSSGEWVLKEDTSITPAGAELVSPPLPVEEAISAMYEVFDAIDGEELFTNNSTGLHINVSVPNPDKIDLLKLLLFMGEGYVLDIFNRKKNTYTQPLLAEVVKYLKTREGDINHTIDELNAFMIENANHYQTIDINKLSSGYLEFRAGGNAGYEKKGKEVEDLVRRYVRIITLASDPDAEREAYLKKLYQAMTSKSPLEMSWEEVGVKTFNDALLLLNNDPSITISSDITDPLAYDRINASFITSDMTYSGEPSKASQMLIYRILKAGQMTEDTRSELMSFASDNGYTWLSTILKRLK